MPLFNGFRFSFNLSSKNDSKLDFSENNASEVYITGAYKPFGEEFIRKNMKENLRLGSESYGEAPKKLTPSMVKLPPSFQPDSTDPDVIQASKSTGDLRQQSTLHKLPADLRKSTPAVSSDPRGVENRQSADTRNTNNRAPPVNNKEQIKLNKKQIAEQKKQEKAQAQQRAKEEKLRKDREKAEQKEQAKQEKLRIQKDKAEAAKAKKDANKNKKNVPPKTRTNPLAQGPNAPLPYATNTLQSSISKSSGPPPYEANSSTPAAKNPTIVAKNPALVAKNPALQAKNPTESSSRSTEQMSKDSTGNVSYAPPAEASTWDMVAAHRVQVSRAPVGGAANKVAIRLQEAQDEDGPATAPRKSLYV